MSHSRVVHQATYVGRRQKLVDFLVPLVGRLVGQERGHLFGRGQRAGDVEARPPQELRIAAQFGRHDAELAELLHDQAVNFRRRGDVGILRPDDVRHGPHHGNRHDARVIKDHHVRIARLVRSHDSGRIDLGDLLVVRLITAERRDIFTRAVRPRSDDFERDMLAFFRKTQLRRADRDPDELRIGILNGDGSPLNPPQENVVFPASQLVAQASFVRNPQGRLLQDQAGVGIRGLTRGSSPARSC